MEKYNYQHIAQLLVNATRNVLLETNKDWLKEKHPKNKIRVRVGSGRATNHKYDLKFNHSITYGVKMVEHKIESYLRCSGWTTGREILERKYFNGNLTPQTCLAHCVLHEYAHFIQTLVFKRVIGSVHNDDFYKILDKMFLTGVHIKVYDYLMQDESFRDISFKNNNRGETGKENPIFNQKNIKHKDYLYFTSRDGKIIKDKIIKVNPKKVQCLNYIVPYRIIIKVE